jgi:hypothetical protein
MQLPRSCFPLFDSFDQAKDTKERRYVIALHKLCARDQKPPLSMAGLDLCSRICGVLPIYLVQSSSFVLGIETVAQSSLLAGGDICAHRPAKQESCLHHRIECLFEGT